MMTLIKLFFYHFLYAGIIPPSSQILNETEIVEMLEDAKKCWIEAALEDGFKNPEPLSWLKSPDPMWLKSPDANNLKKISGSVNFDEPVLYI